MGVIYPKIKFLPRNFIKVEINNEKKFIPGSYYLVQQIVCRLLDLIVYLVFILDIDHISVPVTLLLLVLFY